MTLKQFFTLLFLLLVPLCVMSQEKNDTLKTEKLIIVKQYSPTLNDAFKIKSKPSISDSIKKPQRNVSYSIFSVPVASTFTPAKGVASSVQTQNRPYVFQNYARLGAGNFTNILGEFYGSLNVDQYKLLDINFNHLSSGGGIEEELLDNNFLDSSLDLNLKASENNFIWTAGLGIDLKNYNWYGFDDERLSQISPVFPDDILNIDPSQNYLGINVNGGLQFEDSIVKDVLLTYKNFSDSYNSSENNINLLSDFQFDIQDNSLDIQVEVDYLSGSFERFYNNQLEGGIDYGFFTTSIQPSYQFEKNALMLDIVLKASILNNTEISESDIFIYPKIKASYTQSESLVLYAGLDGDLDPNSYSSLVEQNPFVSPTLFIQPTDNVITGFVGVNGKYKSINYNAKAFYRQDNNYAFFVENPFQVGNFPFQPQTNYEWGNSFGVSYDDLTTIGLVLEANYEAFDDFNIGLSTQISSFSVDVLPEASYLPLLRLNLNANYRLAEKWYFHSTLFYVGERESVGFITLPNDGVGFGSQSVDGFVDFNLGINYQLNEQFGLFLTGQNLFGNNYEQWRNFSVQGIQVMGGISYQFDW